jgi:hypothetical protein
MSTDSITCQRVDDGDLDTRYLAGRLSPEEAAGFEAHYFACDRCWGLVHQGQTIRAALAGPSRGQRRRWAGWTALAAASVALAVGVWRETRDPSRPLPAGEVRGEANRLVPTARADSFALRLTWPRHAGAASYRVRLYGADGAMLLERQVNDTGLSVPRDSLQAPAGAPVYWQVFALDELSREVARSGLVSPSSLP